MAGKTLLLLSIMPLFTVQYWLKSLAILLIGWAWLLAEPLLATVPPVLMQIGMQINKKNSTSRQRKKHNITNLS